MLKKEFDALLKDVRSRAKERNSVVHCMWGVSPNRTDGLISCSHQALVEVGYAATIEALAGLVKTGNPFVDPGFLRSCKVYRKKDFDDIRARINATRVKIQQFTAKAKAVHVKAGRTSAVQ